MAFFSTFSVSALLLVSTTKKEEIFGGRELKLSTKENVFYLSRLLMKQVRSMKQTVGFLCGTSKWIDTLAQVTYMSPFPRQMSAYLYYFRATVKWKTMSTQLSHAGAHRSKLRPLTPLFAPKVQQAEGLSNTCSHQSVHQKNNDAWFLKTTHTLHSASQHESAHGGNFKVCVFNDLILFLSLPSLHTLSRTGCNLLPHAG